MAGPLDPIGGYARPFGAPSQAQTSAEQAARQRGAGYAFESQRNADEERRMYEEQMAALRGLQSGGEARMAAARAPQEAALQVLGERAGTLAGGPAMLANQQALEAAQVRSMVAARTPYGGKGGAPESAILGGQIGQAQAGAIGGLEQEAAARQAAYLRGIQQAGAGMLTEAEQRRLTEAELIKDMQLRFAAAQQIAAANQERRAAQEQQQLGAFGTAVGTVLGSFVGGPAGAAAGAKMGGSIGGGAR